MIELNIRLDVGGQRFTESEFEGRAKRIVGLLRKIGPVDHRVRRLWQDQPRHLVAQICVSDNPDAELFDLAEKLKLNCISVYEPTRNIGRLVGLKIHLLPAFCLEKFERFDDTKNPRSNASVSPKYVPNPDPAVVEAQMIAMYARVRQVFPKEELDNFAPQQQTITDNAIHRVVMNDGPEAVTVDRLEGIKELVTQHLWSPALTQASRRLRDSQS